MQPLDEIGYLHLPRVIADDERGELIRLVESLRLEMPGSRYLLDENWCRALAVRLRRTLLDRRLIPSEQVAIQCSYFGKSRDRNWLVPSHQDLFVPVERRADLPGWSGWSEKEGAIFARPPREVLESLLALRLHLDPCGPDDGPLRVVPASHRRGPLTAAEIEPLRDSAIALHAEAGDAILFRPLLLHASSKATGTSRRRVLHFLFGPPRPHPDIGWRQPVADPSASTPGARCQA